MGRRRLRHGIRFPSRMRLPIRHLVAAASVAILLGCPARAPEPPSEPGTAPGEEEAQALLALAQASPVRDKLLCYDKVIGFHPGTEAARAAHFQKVFYLLDASDRRPAEALEAARIYALRHPGDLQVSECFRWLDNIAGTEERGEDRRAIQEEWARFVEAVLAGLDPSDSRGRARAHAEAGDVRMRQRHFEAAILHLRAAASEPAAPQDLVLRVLFQLGTIEKRDRGDRAAARAAFEDALRIARAGVRGPTVESIEAELEAL
jgi:tetratricopeptide (TPR) repeat protein